MLKSIADRAEFGRVVFETIKKVTALNDPDAISTACNLDSGPAYCETTYELGDAQDRLDVEVDVDSAGKVEKTLTVFKRGAPSLFLYQDGRLDLFDSKAGTQHLREGYPS
jgi:hypothetical protein